MHGTYFPRVGCLRRLRLRRLPTRNQGLLPRFRALSFVGRKQGVIVCNGPKANGARVTAKLNVGTYVRNFAICFASIRQLLARVHRTGTRGVLRSLRCGFGGCSLMVYSRVNCMDFSGRNTRLLFDRLSLESKDGTAVVAAGLPFAE